MQRYTAGGGSWDAEQTRDTIAAALVPGANVTITPNDASDTITIAATGSAGGYATVLDEGTARTQRAAINFVGAGVTATDDATNGRTLVTIPGGTSPTNVIDPTAFGAVGNGVANDNTALGNAIAALTPGDTLLIAAGKIYTHSTVKIVSANGVRITGGGEIRAITEATSSFQIAGNYVTVDNVKFTCPTTTVRGSTLNHEKFVLNACVGAIVRNVVVDGSAATGFFAYGASYYTVDNMQVSNTRADAFHNVNGSHHGLLTNCVATNVGDDGFAVVSYDSGPVCHHIRVIDCRVFGTNTGRGLSVIGGEDCEFEGCYVKGSYGAAIIAATEPAFNGHDINRVLFRNIDIREANTIGSGMPDHGAILVDASVDGSTINDLIIENIKIRDTRAGASRNVGAFKVATATVSGLRFDGITIQGTGPSTPWSTNLASTAYVLRDLKGDADWGWLLLAERELTSPAATTGAITILPYDVIQIVVRVAGMSASDVPALRFNGDTGNNYVSAYLTKAAGSATLTNVETVSTSQARLSGVSTAATRSITVMVNNYASWQKVGRVQGGLSTGSAATAPSGDVWGQFEWANAANTITSVELRTVGGANLNTGAAIFIFGRNV